jgi:hypothetical protein
MTPQELVTWPCFESGWQNKCENGRADATLAKETSNSAKPIFFTTKHTSMKKGNPIIGSLSGDGATRRRIFRRSGIRLNRKSDGTLLCSKSGRVSGDGFVDAAAMPSHGTCNTFLP